MNSHKKAASDHAGGMKLGEVLLVKTTRLEQHHGERVTQSEHYRRARSRRQIQRTGFLLDVYIEKDMGVFREGRTGIATDRDDLDLKARNRRQNPEQLFGFTTRA